MHLHQLNLLFWNPISVFFGLRNLIKCRFGGRVPAGSFLLLTLLIAGIHPVAAQLSSNITRYSTEDGLSHDGILAITRDKDGFMWFGTWDGINRFDGHDFVVYKSRPGDASNLKNNKVRNIVEDNERYLWIETYDNKIYRFDKKTEQFLPISDGPYKSLFKNVVISSIRPDPEGGVWLVTLDRGALYAASSHSTDQPKISVYAKNGGKRFAISGNQVKFFFRDSLNRIWLGTEGGLSCLKYTREQGYVNTTFKPADTRLLSSYSFTCAARNAAYLFFGTAEGNLVMLNLATEKFRELPLSKGTRLNALCYSRKGVLYISTSGKGLISLDPQSFRFRFLGLSPADSYFSLYEDTNGQIWIEPARKGIVKYNPEKDGFRSYAQQQDLESASRDFKVLSDLNGTVWVSMKGGGFGFYNVLTDRIDYFHDQPGAADQQFSNIITSLFIDQSGVMWLSAKDGGINKVISLSERFNFRQLVKTPKTRSDNEVRAMMKDRKGRLWVCTKAGKVYIYKDNKPVRVFNRGEELLGNVYALLEDSQGNVWMGTRGNGLFKAVPDHKERATYTLINYRRDGNDENSLSNNNVYSILEDRHHRIWVGTLGGGLNLMSLKDHKVIFLNHRNSFRHYQLSANNVIRHLKEDRKGNIWIATSNGLLKVDPDRTGPDDYHFLSYKKIPGDRSSLGNNNVQYIHEDKAGQLWVGTFGGGLNRVIPDKQHPDRLSFKVYTTENGLSNDVVLSITNDRDNNIWAATESGLSKFEALSGKFKNYDSNDGLPKSRLAEATCFMDAAGKLYFGCASGYISFDPSAILDKKIKANMALTRIQLYYRDILAGAEGSPLKYAINEIDQLELKHDQNVISIDYAVLDYRAVNKITYAYKLEGFDKIWHHVNDERKATYTNLPPGKYLFKVKATNTGLFENIPQKTLAITVKPPFYLTIWAYLIYALLLTGIGIVARRIIFTMIRLRNKVVVEQKLTEMKLSFFTNISHELRTPLTLIVSPLEEISRTEHLSDRGTDYLNIVNRNANRMIRFINQLLDFRKVQNGKMELKIAEVDLAALLREIGHHFLGIAAEKNISFILPEDEEKKMVWVDEEKIDIIIYNLLSNAFKFSPAGKEIRVALKITAGDDVEIRVTDQGPGVAKNKLTEIFEVYYEGNGSADQHHLKGTGIGLALSREMTANHQGKLRAENNAAEGMTFILELKGSKEFYQATGVLKTAVRRNERFVDEYMPVNTIPPSLNLPDDRAPLVLLVEDNQELRNFLSLKLEGLYRIINAADGEEGWAAAVGHLPDLVISDVMMPNMDGIQLLDLLKNDLRTSHIPVMLLTAKSSVESKIEGLRYGADGYMTKPFHTDYLLAFIENLIASRKKLFEKLSAQQPSKVLLMEPSEIVITSRDEHFLKETIRIIEQGMSDPGFNMETVALNIGMGRTTFYKKLKSLTTLSPVELVRDIRLKRSRQLLDAGEQTVSEIAFLTGFNSLSYFSTCFKEKYKLSPSDYLRKIRTETRENKTVQ
ncbi:hybrid sensor histidine kinase/response regulator transcription factor [Pedobacter sp. AW31-3R]|uniref:hybrid sensor histidine kinase/response regulator transcription factor n=1 Tax=Pedobacter sp. AW31-3R TaxID=3445781 RepID=UPI003F9F0C14